jgi:HAE1 family hydrophobic/amphiphilic exporter-1
MTVSLKASLPVKELFDFGDEYYRKELLRVDGVSRIWMAGGTRREIQVEVDRKNLDNFETTLSAVSKSIANNSMNIPIGRFSVGNDDISFRSIGEYRNVKDIEQVVVNFMGNEIPVSVGDVAVVKDTTMERFTMGRIDLKNDGKVTREQTLLFRIFKQSKANEVKISNGVLKKVKELNEKYKGTEGDPWLTVVTDNAKLIRANIDDVKQTIYEGIFLAIVVVYFFLASWRSTFITALALPNSLIGAFIFMYLFDFSINIISLMSLSLAVGLLIDDAIVVRENIYRHYEEGEEPDAAAQKGTDEVALAVVATTSSVIAVFLPVGFMSGIVGQFFKEFGLTVVFAMFISALDALTIAPMLSAYIIPSHKKQNKPVKNKFIRKATEFFTHIIRLLTVSWFDKVYELTLKIYEKTIIFILKNKIKVLILTVLIFAASILLVKSIPTNFMPVSESGEFRINVETAPDASLSRTNETCIQIEDAIMKLPEVEFAVVSIGNNNRELNIADIYVRLTDFKKRKKSTEEVKTIIRKLLSGIIDSSVIVSLNEAGSGFGGGGNRKPFSLLLFGRETKQLSNLADELMKEFKNIDGLVDLSTNFRNGKPEYQIEIEPEKAKIFGVNSVMAGEELRAMVEGNLPAVFRANGLEYDIRVSFKNEEKGIMDSFNDLYVFNVNNKRLKLSRVAKLIKAEGPTKIYRRDRIRYIEISGNLSKGATLGPIQKRAEEIIKNHQTSGKESGKLWKDISFQYSGNVEEMQELFQNIVMAAVLSIIFIFMVLASLYESVITPFTIMIALPLAAIGGLLALFITKSSLDMFTMIGFIMLLGIVAKNSIILVDYIQHLLRRGLNIHDAVVEAGKIRLRPILMTSLALAAGMLPTALALSEVGKFRQSMGIVIIGGIISSTILTLLVIPAIFEYMDSFRLFLRKIFGRPAKRKIDKEFDKEAKTTDLKHS